VNCINAFVVLNKMLNRPVCQALPWLRLPAQDAIVADAFVKLMISLLLAERDQEDVVSRSFRDLCDSP
jgi:hypothetical protein